MIDLQTFLFNLSAENYEETLNYLENTIFIADHDHFRELLQSLSIAILKRPHSLRLYYDMLKYFSEKIKKFFSSDDVIKMVRVPFLIPKFYEIGIVDIETIIRSSKIDFSIFMMNALEIQATDPEYYASHLAESKDELRHELENANFEMDKLHRMNGVNIDPIAMSIRFDKLDEFKKLIDENHIDLNSKITQSKYELCQMVSDYISMPTFIEYAAFFGSINIFRYLIDQNVILSDRLPEFAIAGGNMEIIKQFSYSINN